jgi:hypothetical protein
MAGEHVARIMAQLPEGSLELYGRVAELVLDAWEQPQLRDELLEDPAGALERAGIKLPDGTSVVVVPPDQAVLPAPGRVTIPLPEGDGPTRRAEARRILERTDFAWLWGEPGATAPPPRPRTATTSGAGTTDFLRDLTRWLPGGPVLPQLWVPMGAAMGVVIVAIVLRLGDLPGGGIAGTAGGDGAGRLAIVVAAGIAGAIVAWWLSRR